jgi:hypothetical protein
MGISRPNGDEDMTKYTQRIEQDSVKAALINGVIEVAFTKADGTLRKINATLSESVVPKANKEDPLSTKAVRKVSPEVCVIWDVDSKGWKSFRWDRLQRINDNTE